MLLLAAVACDADKTPAGDQQGPAPVTQGEPSAGAPAPETAAPSVSSLPDFEVLDKDGNTVKLSDFYGKPILLNFWATWCPPCKAEMPDLQEAYETYGDEVCFVMVNLTDGSRDTVEVVKTFVADNGYTFPVYFDTQSSAAMAYGIYSIPTTFLIGADGELLKSKSGMMTANEVETAMKLLTE